MKNEKSLNVLVVEGNKLNGEVLSKFIKSNAKVDSMEVQTINEVDGVLDEIKRNDVKTHMVILSEPEHSKSKFADEVQSCINQIKKVSPESKVVVLSTPTKVEGAIEFFRSGAYDVVLKDQHASKNVVNSINRFEKRREEKWAGKKQSELSNTY